MLSKVKVSLTVAQYHSDINIKNLLYSKITRLFVTRFCMFYAYTKLRYQLRAYRTIGPLVTCLPHRENAAIPLTCEFPLRGAKF